MIPHLLSLLVLLGVANLAPILATKVLGTNLAAPVDGGITLPDGRPLFGASKTLRGIVASVTVTALAAPLLLLSAETGALLAAASMGGDLLASFTKRRLGLRVHARALGVDQVPEALLPLLLFRRSLDLDWWDIGLLVVAFLFSEIVLSRILFRLHIREKPY